MPNDDNILPIDEDTTQVSFATLENALQEIDHLVGQMEKNGLTLEQSLHHFERGMSLIKSCQKILTQAEQRVQILTQDDGLQAYAEDRAESNTDAAS